MCPLGTTLEALWTGLSRRESGVVRLEETTGHRLAFPFGGQARSFTGSIGDFDLDEAARTKQIRKGLKLMCREIQMGVAAAQFALHHAGLAAGGFDPERTGVSFGSDHIVAVPDEFVAAYRACRNGGGSLLHAWGTKGLAEITPLWLLKYLPNMPASHIAIYNDLRGPNNSITQREVSGLLAIAEATATIRRGAADRMLVGATGSNLNSMRALQASFLGEIAYHAPTPELASRPFDLHRPGMVPGEGAASLILEELEVARDRGATIYGEVVRSASSCVARRNGTGDLRGAIRNALSRAALDLAPHELGHLHAHGLGTLYTDEA
ncbi:MAG TPA: beta-ketoacyl synthase N-terminal-like domain-containing protein, partial [Pirellulaceae bacterium]